MSMTLVSIMAGLSGCGLTLVTTWVRGGYRERRVLKVAGGLPEGSLYIDDASGIRIQIGHPEPPQAPGTAVDDAR